MDAEMVKFVASMTSSALIHDWCIFPMGHVLPEMKAELIKRGLLEKVGEGTSTFYRLTEKGKAFK